MARCSQGNGRRGTEKMAPEKCDIPTMVSINNKKKKEKRERRKEERLKLTEADLYIGDWVADKREGPGTCMYNNGDKYEGTWEKDSRHGFGVLVPLS